MTPPATNDPQRDREALARRFAEASAASPPPVITVQYVPRLGTWAAASSDLRQGTVSGTPEVVLSAIAAWMRGER